MAVLALEAVAQIAHTVVGRLHTHVLLLDDMAHVRRQLVVLKCVAILSSSLAAPAVNNFENGIRKRKDCHE
jgi:hypothetical protein